MNSILRDWYKAGGLFNLNLKMVNLVTAVCRCSAESELDFAVMRAPKAQEPLGACEPFSLDVSPI